MLVNINWHSNRIGMIENMLSFIISHLSAVCHRSENQPICRSNTQAEHFAVSFFLKGKGRVRSNFQTRCLQVLVDELQ